MTLARRSDVPIAVISLFQQIPYAGSARLEVFRGATTIDHLHRMIDVLCNRLDYYPARADASPATAPAASTRRDD
ncbi:MAG: hypothetical protein K2Q20_02595 [Phycisphaerales bacterium]|nr:hypothetical protein [Phycisphaerales bacterium]